jgi:hypothetical protein
LLLKTSSMAFPDDRRAESMDSLEELAARFSSERAGVSIPRAVPRVTGEGWNVSVGEAEAEFRVLNVSRLGVCIEGNNALKVDSRYSLQISGPSGPAVLDLLVLRCTLHQAEGGKPSYRIAGMFCSPLEREDLPGGR